MNRSYLQKYAMHFGTYMGIYWILKFILFPAGIPHTFPFAFICNPDIVRTFHRISLCENVPG